MQLAIYLNLDLARIGYNTQEVPERAAMKNTIRTFVAVEMSDAVRQRAAELIGVFAATGTKVSWVKPHNLHLTLKFLDEVPLSLIPQVSAAVQKAVVAFEPFELEICTAWAFPSTNRPQTLWLGTGHGSETLFKLHAALERALKPIGFPKEHRRFAAHLTIGRVRTPCQGGMNELALLIQQHADFTAGRLPVTELVVFSSQLTPQGAIYEVVNRVELTRTE